MVPCPPHELRPILLQGFPGCVGQPGVDSGRCPSTGKGGSAFCPFHGGRSPGSATRNPDFQAALGSEGEAFQRELAAFLGVRHSLLVNSGTSADLLAIAALTSASAPAIRRPTAASANSWIS